MIAWGARLESMLVRELLAEYHRLDADHFKGALRAPTIALVATTTRLGAWRGDTRTLEISRPLVLRESWGVVVEVLKHEMAHQYAHEVLGATDEAAHGPAFRQVCERFGIDAAARGVPSSAGGGAERVIAKVAHLLALAESPERHEAQAAMAAAQRLMLEHNLEHACASAHRYEFRQLGRVTGRTTEAERLLAMILGKHFFVEVLWVAAYRPTVGRRGSVLEVSGTPENLAIAAHVHSFLSSTADRLWEEHRTRTGLSRMERRTYLSGVMAGFAEKLDRQARAHHKEGLVWLKDADLESYQHKRHPYVRHVRYAGNRRTVVYAQGKAAGHTIVLCQPIGAAAASRGRLLGQGG